MAEVKLDSIAAAAVDMARAAAIDSGGEGAVGTHLGVSAEAERVVTHSFACLLTGYPDWYWAVTLVRASRARVATVNEVVLLPRTDALLAPAWVPWEQRIQPGDISPGMLMPTPDNDPRLEPGFAATDLPADADPAEWTQLRSTVAELGLGRERVLSAAGRDAGLAPTSIPPRMRGSSVLSTAVAGIPMWWPLNVRGSCLRRCSTPSASMNISLADTEWGYRHRGLPRL